MTEAWVLSFTLVLVRIATFWFVMPVWSTLQPPRMVKMGLVLSLSVFWFSGLQQPMESAVQYTEGSGHWAMLAVLAVREIFLGGMLGFAFHVFLVPMQIAGAYIGQELGLSMATMTDPASGAINNIVATLMQAIAVCLFFVFDFHHFIIHCLDISFELIPAGQPFGFDSVSVALFEFANLTGQGLMISMPVAVVMFVAMIALLVLARAVPALNLFSVGMSIRLILGFVAMLVFLPHLLARMSMQFESSQSFLESLLSSFLILHLL